MGTYVNNNIVTLGSSVDYDDAVREIAQLLAIGPRGGRYHLSDICQSPTINIASKNKPFPTSDWNFASDTKRNNARFESKYGVNVTKELVDLGYVNSYNANIVDAPSVGVVGVNKHITPVPNFYEMIYNCSVHNNTSEVWKRRLRDFDGYRHDAAWGIGSPYAEGTGTYRPNAVFPLSMGNTLYAQEDGAIGIEDIRALYPDSYRNFYDTIGEYGLEFRCNDGVVLDRLVFGNYSDMVDLIGRESPSITHGLSLYNSPSGNGGKVYLYGRNIEDDIVYRISKNSREVVDSRSPNLIKTAGFNLGMEIVTYTSDETRDAYYYTKNNIETNSLYGMVGFKFSICYYELSNFLPPSLISVHSIKLQVTHNGTQYLIPVRVHDDLNPLGEIEKGVWHTFTYYVTQESWDEIFDYNVETEATFQFVASGTSSTEVSYVITSPITLKVRNVQHTYDKYPDIDLITPDDAIIEL